MKHCALYLKITGCVLLLLIYVFVSCTPEAKDDPVPNDPDAIEITGAEANKITKSIKLKNGIVMPGKIPPFPVTADLKIDRDTIFWVKGIKARIRIKKPLNIHYGILSVQVANSNSYIKAEFEEEEETDSTSVFYFDFDEEPEWDPPLSFNIKIVPEDENGVPQDSISVPVEIEEPISDGAKGCGFENYWQWTYNTEGGKINLAPGYGNATTNYVKGCCIEGKSVYSGSAWICPTKEQRSVEFVAAFYLNVDYILLREGMAYGGMSQYTQNLDVGTTDFCNLNPGYNKRTTVNEYESTYTIDPNSCTLTMDGFEGHTEPIFDDYGNYYGEAPLPIYAGSGPVAKYTMISKHYMQETRNVEGTPFTRYYWAPFSGTSGKVPDTKGEWYD